MRKILINGSYAPSLINFRGHLIQQMIARGHEVHVSAPNFEKETVDRLLKMGARVHEVKMQRTGVGLAGDVKYFFQLRRLMKKVGVELVLNYTIKPNIYGGLAARSIGSESASIVSGLGYAFYETNGFKHRVVQTLSRWLYKRATTANSVVIFQNPDDRDDFIKAGCLLDRNKVRMINGSGVDTNYYSVARLPEAPIFLIISRLLVSKGVREYANAARIVMSRRPDCKFFIAGFLDGGPDSVSQNELDEWIGWGIEFLGHLDDVRPAIENCSIYVLPSYREGTPRTVLEASAMGRASIVTDAPGCRETVIQGETGYLVPVRESAALADAMLTMAEDPAMRAKMGGAARKFCEEKYAVSKVNNTLINHLDL
ncbi:glycosyltransferase family 4 protein [Parasphingorhabdus sp.]